MSDEPNREALPGYQVGLLIPEKVNLTAQLFLDLRREHDDLPNQFEKITHWVVGNQRGPEMFYWETEDVYFYVEKLSAKEATVLPLNPEEAKSFILRSVALQRITRNPKAKAPLSDTHSS